MPAPAPIIDVHTHLNGPEAILVYRRAADLYGVSLAYSMTRLEEVETIRDAMDGRVRFIAVPNYWNAENRLYEFTTGFLKRIESYHALGSRIVKFWVAPRSRDLAEQAGDRTLMQLDAPHKIEAMKLATELGMIFMVHVADPDTWFATKYADARKYGTKLAQYEPLNRLLDEFTQPWIAAHMGGWPEDLEFLTNLLERHPNLYLDTSAAKWMIRELSRHSRQELHTFLLRFRGRILFGSDIVTTDEHLDPEPGEHEQHAKAGSEDEAFDLYASRYWALRTMFETDYEGESPIADPDLAMIDPDTYTELDAPPLAGKSLPVDVLKSLYHDAAHNLLEPLHQGD
jgi:predicted TIM-barrel fold metal-dependent hydrolase